jgi:hypothetical protein
LGPPTDSFGQAVSEKKILSEINQSETRIGVGGSFRVLHLLPPLKLVAMILLKVALNTKNEIKSTK